MAKRPPHLVRRRPGFFHPVVARARRDGWTVERQCGFLAQLYFTGSVTAAARAVAVGMTRESAHRPRTRAGAESFAAARGRVLAPPGSGHPGAVRKDFRKVTNAALLARLEMGLIQPVIYRRRLLPIQQKPDNSAPSRMLRQANGGIGSPGARGADGEVRVFIRPPVSGPRGRFRGLQPGPRSASGGAR